MFIEKLSEQDLNECVLQILQIYTGSRARAKILLQTGSFAKENEMIVFNYSSTYNSHKLCLTDFEIKIELLDNKKTELFFLSKNEKVLLTYRKFMYSKFGADYALKIYAIKKEEIVREIDLIYKSKMKDLKKEMKKITGKENLSELTK